MINAGTASTITSHLVNKDAISCIVEKSAKNTVQKSSDASIICNFSEEVV